MKADKWAETPKLENKILEIKSKFEEMCEKIILPFSKFKNSLFLIIIIISIFEIKFKNS